MTTKTTIQGAPRKYDEEELQQRQQQRRYAYTETSECCHRVMEDQAFKLISKVIELSKEGYALSAKYPISSDYLSHSCFMVKPERLAQEELEKINKEVKEAYIQELQSEREHYKQLLKQQLLEADEAKEQKKILAAKAKRLAEIQREVDECYGDLKVPE